MRIAVECGGFRDAAEACHTANHIAALMTESLVGKLDGYAGMAGDDSTSLDFATSYDDGAREAVATLAELTHAFIGLGRLLRNTGANHAAAEAASAGMSPDDEGHQEPWRRVGPDDPPSSLGADEPSLGEIDRWILDRVEGFVWPGADVSLLRDAALTWQRTASTVERLTLHLDVVEPLLRRQESPEVPVALEVVASLRGLVVAVADELVALGQACDDYADSVEETHDRTRALLTEIGRMVVEGALVSAVVGAITGGLGATGSVAATVARIRAQAPRFHALLLSARAAGSAGASRVRAARDSLAKARGELERFARVPARDERGSAVNPLARLVGRDRHPGWLQRHEVPPGHTIDRHVGKSVDELRERLRQTSLREASSFPDERTAEVVIDRVLGKRSGTIRDWMASDTRRALRLEVDLQTPTGLKVLRDGTVQQSTAVRVVLIPSDEVSDGWQILTAFPA